MTLQEIPEDAINDHSRKIDVVEAVNHLAKSDDADVFPVAEDFVRVAEIRRSRKDGVKVVKKTEIFMRI